MSQPANTTRLGNAPILWCVLSAALFGASTPASKPLLQFVSPLLLSGLLYLGAAIAVAPWALRGLGSLRTADRKNIWRLAGAVAFGGVIGPVLLLTGLSIASAGSVSLWLNLETVATAILARLFFKEHLGIATWIAVVLIITASIILSPSTPGGGVAIILVALACIAWGLDNNLTSVIDRFSPAQVTFAKGAAAGAINITLGLTIDQRLLPAAITEAGAYTGAGAFAGTGLVITATLIVGAFSYGASLLLYIASAQHLGATRSQLIFSTAPAWGLLLSWFVLGEDIRSAQLFAAALMAVAIWLWYRERHHHRHLHVRMTHRHFHRHDDSHHDHEHPTPVAAGTWHTHEHTHEPVQHEHPHRPDLHHRHDH